LLTTPKLKLINGPAYPAEAKVKSRIAGSAKRVTRFVAVSSDIQAEPGFPFQISGSG